MAEIGILTFHRCINYGSYWQARCLAEGLRRRGLDAVLLDHHSGPISRQEWRCALRPIPGAWGEGDDRQLYARKTRKFLAAFDQMPLSQPFDLGDPEEAEPVDLVMVGSDEVWNPRHPWYGGQPIFYGDGLRTSRRASYAASFGNHSATSGLEAHWIEKLRAFHDISVRDANSRRIVSDVLAISPPVVLDPVLQFPDLIDYDPVDDGPPYVAVYGHDFPEWLHRRVRRWAAEQGRRVISVGYRNWWVDEHWIEAGPGEFAAFIAAADAVVTNFFHGCVFALVNGKPFATTPSDYRFNKVRDLMAAVGSERHLIHEDTPPELFHEALSEAPDSAIAGRIAELRQQSEAYLDHVLA